MPDVVAGGCFFWEIDRRSSLDPTSPSTPSPGRTPGCCGAVARPLRRTDRRPRARTRCECRGAAQRSRLLQAASDMELSQASDQLKVRIVNYTGHKLPTGYPEGRRMWLNVRFFDAGDDLVAERGALRLRHRRPRRRRHEGLRGPARHGRRDRRSDRCPAGRRSTSCSTTRSDTTTASRRAASRTRLRRRCRPSRSTTTYADGQYWDDTLFDVPPGRDPRGGDALLPDHEQGVHRVPARHEPRPDAARRGSRTTCGWSTARAPRSTWTRGRSCSRRAPGRPRPQRRRGRARSDHGHSRLGPV